MKSLERIPLFAGLSHKDRERVARWADEIDPPADKHLLDEGRLPHEFFVILDGGGRGHARRRAPGDDGARGLLR